MAPGNEPPGPELYHVTLTSGHVARTPLARACPAAAYLAGRHDFSSFRAAEYPVKTLDPLEVARRSAEITITARPRLAAVRYGA